GTIEWYDEQMLILQEKLNAAFNQDIDRGSRIIDYHNLLLEYRKLQQRWSTTISLANKLKNLENAMRSPHETPSGGMTRNRGSDVEMMDKIMHRINNPIEWHEKTKSQSPLGTSLSFFARYTVSRLRTGGRIKLV